MRSFTISTKVFAISRWARRMNSGAGLLGSWSSSKCHQSSNRMHLPGTDRPWIDRRLPLIALPRLAEPSRRHAGTPAQHAGIERL